MAKRLRWDGLTPERRAKFIEGLVETGSVTRAALFAGKRNASAFYKLRERDADFAEQWDAALAGVSARLETELVARALAAEVTDREIKLAPLSFDETLRLLHYFRARDRGAKFGPRRRYATREETDAALMEKLDMLEARVRKRRAKERAVRRAAREGAGASKSSPSLLGEGGHPKDGGGAPRSGASRDAGFRALK